MLKGKRKALRNIRRRADRLVQELGVEVVDRLIAKSPVESGRYAANWRVGIGRPDGTVDFQADAGDIEAARQRARAMLQTAKAGDRIFITNAVPYSLLVEYGGEHHAPRAVVALTAAELRRIAPGLARRVRRL